jgi:hypothetical protein
MITSGLILAGISILTGIDVGAGGTKVGIC